LPKRGTPGDLYIQTLMMKELDKDMTTLLMATYASWATVGGESGSSFADKTVQAYRDVQALVFPWRKNVSSPQRDTAELGILEAYMKRSSNYGLVEKAHARAKAEAEGKPMGFVDRMAAKLMGKKPT
jgi:hypothetical protein